MKTLDLLEKDWDAQLFNSARGLAPNLGWLSYHTLRSKGSRSGFPDRVLVRDRILYAELKRERTKPTDEQVRWLDKLASAGGEVYLWRPSDLDEIGRILSRPWQYLAVGDGNPVLVSGFERWTPDCLWPRVA